jgi:hypothetical protein
MGFLDKLLGRKKSDASEGMATAPPPASMPADTPPPAAPPAEESHEGHSHGEGEGEHSH